MRDVKYCTLLYKMDLSCRLCLVADTGEKLKNVFQCNVKHVEDSLVDVLFWVFSVEIDVTDPFSKDICSECIQLIEYILQVKNTFQRNQENLKRYSQNGNCSNLNTESLDDGGVKKVSDIGQRSSASVCTSPTNSPSKSRYNSKIYGSNSPRVRVSLSSIEEMCPISINLVQLENTQEYLRYRRLKNGSFKRRKYRHFNMDGALLDDICNTLENKSANTESLRKEIGVSTEYSLLSKAINTDERNVCNCYKNITSPLNPLTVDNASRDYLTTDTTEKDDNFLDIIGLTNTVDNTLSPEGGREYDWTTLTFKKDASTNTESTTPTTRDIGINATVQSTTTGTLTKRFKQMKKKNVVKVNVDSLESFCPIVVLEPLEDILDTVDYKKIDTFRYIKKSTLSSEIGAEDSVEHDDAKTALNHSPNCVEISKKQKFLDYYKNFSSFAVRELITGKKIRESETSPVYKIANVCSVFVCDFCSKSFLSNISLDMHYKRAHKTRNELDDVVIVDLVDSEGKTPNRSKKSMHIRGKRSVEKPAGEKTDTVKNDNVGVVDFTSEGPTETPTNDIERQSENCSSNDSVGKKVKGLRNIAQKINYNLNAIMRLKTRGKQIPLKINKIKRRTGKLKRLENNMKMMLVNKEIEKKNVSYIWDRKRLGKYSAISYYKNYSGEEKPPLLALEQSDVKHKQDMALNETIQKLANRLDTSCTTTV